MYMKMKKMRLAIPAFVLAFVITLSPTSVVAYGIGEEALQSSGYRASNEFPILGDESVNLLAYYYDDEHMLNQIRALEIVDDIFDSFPRSRSGEIIYPNYFGGLYLDCYGNLVVLVVDTDVYATEQNTFARAFSHDVAVRYVDFSYSELLATSDILWYKLQGEYRDVILEMVNLWFTYTIGNRIIVELFDISEEQIARFRSEILDSHVNDFRESRGPMRLLGNYTCQYETNIFDEYTDYYTIDEYMICFDDYVSCFNDYPIYPDEYVLCYYYITCTELESIDPLNQNISIAPGQALAFNEGSIGWPAFRIAQGVIQRGFVTTAHSVGANGSRVGVQLSPGFAPFVGTVRARNPVTDSAFVELDQNVAISFRVLGTSTLLNTSARGIRPPAGTRVSAAGTNRTEGSTIRTGAIRGYNIHWPPSGSRSMVEVAITSHPGNSGGVVYHGSNPMGIVVGDFGANTLTTIVSLGDYISIALSLE